MKRFITGTDTGVGKTTITSALANVARTLGRSVFAFKPIETGGQNDQQLLGNGLYSFSLPRAPWVASRAEGIEIDLSKVVDRVSRETADLVLVEGAGGWRVPVTATADISDLAKILDVPVIIVGRASLGTINHSLLTIQAVEKDRLAIAGLVLSHRPEDELDLTLSNVEQLRSRWDGTILVYQGDPQALAPLLVDP